MRLEILCPVKAPLRPKPGDGLIRSWLSMQGWRVGDVKNGVIRLPTVVHAEYMQDMVARKWFPDVPPPQVGVYSEEV